MIISTDNNIRSKTYRIGTRYAGSIAIITKSTREDTECQCRTTNAEYPCHDKSILQVEKGKRVHCDSIKQHLDDEEEYLIYTEKLFNTSGREIINGKNG